MPPHAEVLASEIELQGGVSETETVVGITLPHETLLIAHSKVWPQ